MIAVSVYIKVKTICKLFAFRLFLFLPRKNLILKYSEKNKQLYFISEYRGRLEKAKVENVIKNSNFGLI